MNLRNFLILTGYLFCSLLFSACKKYLPKERLSLGADAQFSTYTYSPVLGRNTLYDNFNGGSSSLPLNFKLLNMRKLNGDPAPELTENFPVLVWKSPYEGNEKSLAEIEAKRAIENHPLFEIREHSGQFLMWYAARSNFVAVQSDSGYVFDVEVSNSGGRRYFKNFKLKPFRERPYEPSNLDPLTGQASTTQIKPTTVNGMYGQRTNRMLNSNDIGVLFNKKEGLGNTITVKFVDSLFNPINPNNFALTKWESLLHGFDMVKTAESVTYKVAYPIPLVTYPTAYTTGDGTKAKMAFSYERQGFGNNRILANLRLEFNIFEKGDWELTFWFKNESPKFEND